jgi:hypothetical protein
MEGMPIYLIVIITFVVLLLASAIRILREYDARGHIQVRKTDQSKGSRIDISDPNCRPDGSRQFANRGDGCSGTGCDHTR